jgi:hypothetical protein
MRKRFLKFLIGARRNFGGPLETSLRIERLSATNLETRLIHIAVEGYWITLNLEVTPQLFPNLFYAFLGRHSGLSG